MMQPIRYACLGCAYCYPAVAQNAFPTAFSSLHHFPAGQCNFEAATLNRQTVRTRLSDYDHNNQVRLLVGSILPAQAYQKAMRLRQLLRQQILDTLSRVDVLVMPTSSIPAPLIPERAGIRSKQEVTDGFAGRRGFTAPFNLASIPALSVNCGFTSEGLPIGLQIAARPFAEATVFRVSHAYEQATNWHTRRPPI